MKKSFAYNHKPISFEFTQRVDNFFVEEIPLFKFSNRGSYLILKIKKVDMSTFKLISVIAKATKLEYKDIGYAGLKDKNATTIQYISIPRRYERDAIRNLITQRIEILEKSYFKYPIKIGQLQGNKFSITLNNVTPQANKDIREIALKMQKYGIPNYYGYQRFGEDSKSYLQGKMIAHSGKKLKGAKEKLLVSAYQSHLFNKWLSKRVYISYIVNNYSIKQASKILSFSMELVEVLAKQPNIFKLFLGDDMKSYPYGKSYPLQDFEISCRDFQYHQVSPTGLLCGSQTDRSMSDARYLEEEFDDQELYSLKGSRRYAWIWPEELSFGYSREKREFILNFYLPKGSFATTFLEEIAKRSLK
jgi:tRNA pseudouridine13 synthase